MTEEGYGMGRIPDLDIPQMLEEFLEGYREKHGITSMGVVEEEEYLTARWLFGFAASDEEFKEIKRLYKERLKELTDKKNADEISDPEFSEGFGRTIQDYKCLGIPEGLRHETRKILKETDFSSEGFPYDPEIFSKDEVDPGYQAYMTQLYFNEDMEGEEAQEAVCSEIADIIEGQEEVEDKWIEGLAPRPAEKVEENLAG